MARPNGPITICIINLKGGVGKSTIAALLCQRAFTDRGADVLAIDLDPQANLSQAFMHTEYNVFLNQRRPSIVEIFNGYQPPAAPSSGPAPLHIQNVITTIATRGATSLQLIPSRFDFSDQLTSSLRPDPKILARFLSKEFKQKDLIIIDCTPTESILTHAAYHASSHILVPVKPEYFATIGFPLLQQSLTNFRYQNRGHHIDVVGVVINNAFYDGGNDGGPEKAQALKEIYQEAEKNGWDVFEQQIPFSRGFPKIMRGNHSYSGNATMFPRFAQAFFDKIGL